MKGTQRFRTISEGVADHSKPIYGYEDPEKGENVSSGHDLCFIGCKSEPPKHNKHSTQWNRYQNNLFIANVLMDFKVLLHMTNIT